MGNMFSRPKVEAPPRAPDPTPLPIRDDVAERREKRKVWANIASRTGDGSTRLSGMAADLSRADTRSGVMDRTSTILGAS
jgi:hypothetical protein